jgi:hypothetical protein
LIFENPGFSRVLCLISAAAGVAKKQPDPYAESAAQLGSIFALDIVKQKRIPWIPI